MTILYIGYWGANEGLSQATIIPHLKIFDELGVDRILYASIERHHSSSFHIPVSPHIIHLPIFTPKSSFHFFSKWLELVTVYRQLVDIMHKYTPDLIICRSALAGIYGYWLHKKFRIPFYVESFEPHGKYMLDSGVWSRFGLSYLFYQWHEQKIMAAADMLMPVAQNYLHKLIEEGVREEKIRLMPCAVDIKKFAFNPQKRKLVRDDLNIDDDAVVGIYVGKFGGIYFDEQAFEIFDAAFMYYHHFFLIILTPYNAEEIRNKIKPQFQNKVWINTVSHDNVPNYLSAADFAFSLIKPSESRIYCSPIKNGEFFANGLPVISPDKIGDDSEIIEKENVGIVFKESEISFEKLQELISPKDRLERIPLIAKKYRSFNIVSDVYRELLVNWHKNYAC